MHGVDALGAVDALQVDGRDCQVRVPDLAPNDDQRDYLAGHLDGAGATQLVRWEAPAHGRRRSRLAL